MAVLIIGAEERARIAEIVNYARAHPVTLDVVRHGIVDDTDVLKLEDRVPGIERPPSAHVAFPGGFHAAFSIEQQPAGFCSHLSISVERKGKMPSLEAVQMIAEEFGVPFPPDKAWNEEFEPGQYAVNLLSLMAPTDEGHT
jgi:hypothetical protein